MSSSLKIIKILIFSFVMFTFLISTFSARYYEHYEKSETAVFNSQEMSGFRKIGEGNICMEYKQPLWGMATYYQLFPSSFLMVAISAVLILITFIASIFKRGILSKRRDKIIFICSIVIILWSYAILLGAWFGVVPAFYNCAELY